MHPKLGVIGEKSLLYNKQGETDKEREKQEPYTNNQCEGSTLNMLTFFAGRILKTIN